MNRYRRLIIITLFESLSTVLIERGLYFYTVEKLAFGTRQNLMLALSFGVVYVVGAMLSHRLSVRVGEKRLLVGSVMCQLLLCTLVPFWPSPAVLYSLNASLGLVNGFKWPVVESYVSAGRNPKDTAGAIGRFNVAWSLTVPLGVMLAGLIIATWSPGLFLTAALCSALSLPLILTLERRPVHLPADHPDRPSAQHLLRFRGLLVSSRWSMFCNYALLMVLVPLLPLIFKDLGYSVEQATALASVLEWTRFIAFIMLTRYLGWHGRAGLLLAVIVLLPLSFFLVISAQSLPVILIGEMLFGAAAGMSYNAALYYAMVISNASVDASGDHEGLIGLSFVVGPLTGLAGSAIAVTTGSVLLGMAGGVGPLILLCTAGTLRPLLKLTPITHDDASTG